MNTTVLDSAPQLLALAHDRDLTTAYRGVSDAAFALVPRVGRHPDPSRLDEVERDSFLSFKLEAQPYLEHRPANDWEWLALAQHHGLPTRLLDWTWNPLVAAFFAVETSFSRDGAIYVFSNVDPVLTGATPLPPSPFSLPAVAVYMPTHLTRRIQAQSGVFTIHPSPREAFAHANLERYLIPKERKLHFERSLAIAGVHKRSLFPALDGVAAYLRAFKSFDR